MRAAREWPELQKLAIQHCDLPTYENDQSDCSSVATYGGSYAQPPNVFPFYSSSTLSLATSELPFESPLPANELIESLIPLLGDSLVQVVQVGNRVWTRDSDYMSTLLAEDLSTEWKQERWRGN